MRPLSKAVRTGLKSKAKKGESNSLQDACEKDDVVANSQETESPSELSKAQDQESWCQYPELALAIFQTRNYYRTYFNTEGDRPKFSENDEQVRILYRNFLSADLLLKRLLEVFHEHVKTYEKKHIIRNQQFTTVQSSLKLWKTRVESISTKATPYCVDDLVLNSAVDMLKIQHDEKSAAEELDMDEDVFGLDNSVAELSLVQKYEEESAKGSAFNRHSLTLVDEFLKQRKVLHNEIALNNNKLRKMEKELSSLNTNLKTAKELLLLPKLQDHIEQVSNSGSVLMLKEVVQEGSPMGLTQMTV